jgi:hypothetical protein
MVICHFISNLDGDKEKPWKCERCGYETNFLGQRECKSLPIQKNPNIFKRIANFTYAFSEHLYKGMPTVSQEQLDERLKICKECPLFKQQGLVGGICTHENCGCNIQDEIVFLNKIAWADQRCPIGKWLEIDKKGV